MAADDDVRFGAFAAFGFSSAWLASLVDGVILVGGAAMDGPRHIWWNFVSSSKERIEKAKADWRDGRFAKVPGDAEFIPLPDR